MENPARAAIQMLHRIGALIVTLSIVILIYLFRKYEHLKASLILIGALLISQVTLGILNVVLSLPILVAVLHNAVALLLLLSVIGLIHKVFQKPT